jgi:hypothetical protein
MTLLSESLINFYLERPVQPVLPAGIGLMNPYSTREVRRIVRRFYKQYYADANTRIPLVGINPGRFGAGITGITFTDPIRLATVCGISNTFSKRQELSSVFIYQFISRFGGPQAFFSKFFLSAVFPLGFTRNGKNLNYYDDRALLEALEDQIVDSMKTQLEIIGSPDTLICLGEGKNYRYLEQLNDRLGMVKKIIPLPHPRWVMQYRYKRRGEYVERYLETARQSIA